MNLQYYPYPIHLFENIFKKICSEHGGIMQSLLISPLKCSDEIDIKSFAGQMPHYHKVLLDPSLDVQYHLTGYGTFHEEAIIRLIGEAIERYSLMVSHYLFTPNVKYATYNEIKREGNVIPFEYLQLFSEADYVKLNRGNYKGLQPLTPNDVVGWLKCASLYQPGTDIWVPLQLLFVGYKINREKREVAFAPGFSTGTAAHLSLEKALLNAVLEFIQIDAFMINWYSKRPASAIIVDDLTILQNFPRIFLPDSNFQIIALDLRVFEKIPVHVIGSILINKKEERPFIVCGIQGHLNPLKGFYRSLMEAVAIKFLGTYGPLYLPKEYFKLFPDNTFTDLDTNVAFFASPQEAHKKRELVLSLTQGEKFLSLLENYESYDTRKDLQNLIQELSSEIQYAAYLDITPPEAREHGWYVMRTFIPELITMCVPGVPYSKHPRFQKFGGIQNEYPHPLP